MRSVDDEAPPICCAQLSASGFTEQGPAAALAAVGRAFRQRRAVVLHGFLSPELDRLLAPIWRAATFELQSLPGLGERRVEAPGRTADALCLMLTRPRLLRWVEALTGCGRLGGVAGDVVQMQAGGREHLGWHDDGSEHDRRLGLTVNLGAEPYAGGVFELRRKAAGEVIFRHQHGEPGAAALFDVGPGLEHRVTPLDAGGPRTVFAGWFTGA